MEAKCNCCIDNYCKKSKASTNNKRKEKVKTLVQPIVYSSKKKVNNGMVNLGCI